MRKGKRGITRVNQPHTCKSSVPFQQHSQCTARYMGYQVLDTIYDPDVSIAVLIRSLIGFTKYRSSYGETWRAKQEAMAMWRDWKNAYGRVPRILKAMNHYNPGVKWFKFTTGMEAENHGVVRPMLLWQNCPV